MTQARPTGETEDIVPEDVAQDEDYKRAVQSLEDQHHGRAGYLAARGALDKGDQAYLKEQEQLQRHKEEALQENELAEFAAARALAEKEALLRSEAERKRAAATATAKKNELKVKKKRVLPTITKIKSSDKGDTQDASKAKKSKTTAEENDDLSKKEEPSKILSKNEAIDGEEKEEEGGGILAGLLGGYDSADSDTKEDTKEKDTPKSGLPSAADLLLG